MLVRKLESRDEYAKLVTKESKKLDKFCGRFLKKTDDMDAWEKVWSVFDDDGSMMGAVMVTVAKRNAGNISNLQLLHTWYNHRRKGVANILVQKAFEVAKCQGKYMRISMIADDGSLDFYRNAGFVIIGKQRAGSYFSMCRLEGDSLHDSHFDLTDPVIRSVATSGTRGSVVEFLVDLPELDNELNLETL
jgi:ribosomal protein S18 acetylase RimI-like enzyme